ncbi:MAG: hypothetical protein V4714_04830 [Bacteroidota bacterium]
MNIIHLRSSKPFIDSCCRFLWLFSLVGWLIIPASAQQRLPSTAIDFEPQANERFLSAFLRKPILKTGQQPEELVLFSVVADTRSKRSILKVSGFDASQGKDLWHKNLDSNQVHSWLALAGKGAVAQSFENAVANGLRGNEAIPLEYQYLTSFSPDGNRILVYTYDYSQKSLLARTSLFDRDWRLVHHENIRLDKQAINYGLFVNNEGSIFILNTDRATDIQLIEYLPQTNERYLMEVPGGSTTRRDLRLAFIDNEAWVISTVENKSGVTGLMLIRFDMKTRTTLQVQFISLPESLKTSPFNELVGIRINNRREISVVLDNRNILSSGYVYNPRLVNNATQWKPRKSMVQLGNCALITYDTLGVSLDEQLLRREEKISDDDFYQRVSYVVSPQPGLPESLITEKQWRRLEKTKDKYYLTTEK